MQMASTSAMAADGELSDLPAQSVRTNQPKDSKLRQQKLPAWQPILTAGTVVPWFLAVGLLFLPVGVVLYVSTSAVVEYSIDYTECENAKGEQCNATLAEEAKKLWPKPCICEKTFQIEEDLTGEVFFYYGLSNFYQNHRRYVKSRSDAQLLGETDAVTDCSPLQYMKTADGKELPIAPCGSIANSLFNDSFSLSDSTGAPVNITWEGVVWPTDRGHKFQNPSGGLAKAFAPDAVAKPPAWHLRADQLDNTSLANNGFENTDLIVWMRTAALPTFRKLWRRLKQGCLPKGEYTLRIEYNYPVSAFDGTKRFIVSTASWAGGKNSFLGVAYMVVGSLCLCLAALFLFVHLRFGKSLAEMSTINAPHAHTRP